MKLTFKNAELEGEYRAWLANSRARSDFLGHGLNAAMWFAGVCIHIRGR